MNCEHCNEPISENEIQCRNCEAYVSASTFKFYALDYKFSIVRFFFRALGYLILLYVLFLLISSEFIGIVVLLAIGVLFIYLSSSTKHYDCPICHAKKSVLIKHDVIKSSCTHCHSMFEIHEHE